MFDSVGRAIRAGWDYVLYGRYGAHIALSILAAAWVGVGFWWLA